MQHETARCTCHPKSACGSYTRMQSWSFSAHVRDLDVTALAADVGPQQGAGARAGCAFARSSCFDCLHVQRTRSQCLSTCTCLAHDTRCRPRTVAARAHAPFQEDAQKNVVLEVGFWLPCVFGVQVSLPVDQVLGDLCIHDTHVRTQVRAPIKFEERQQLMYFQLHVPRSEFTQPAGRFESRRQRAPQDHCGTGTFSGSVLTRKTCPFLHPRSKDGFNDEDFRLEVARFAFRGAF